MRLKHEPLYGFKAHELAFRNADFTLSSALIPNAQGVSVTPEWRVPYAINSWGLRDREYPAGKPPGTVRILALGDSHIEGFGVRIEDTVVKRLEAALNAPGGPRRPAVRYEVLNGGSAAYSPLLEYLFLRQRGLQFAPDLVILFYHFTDLPDDTAYEARTLFDPQGRPMRCLPLKRIRAHGRHPVERWLSRHSRAFLYLEHKLNAYGYKRFIAPHLRPEPDVDVFAAYRGSPDEVAAMWARNQRYLGLIDDLLRARGIPWILVSYPSAAELSPEEWAEGRGARDLAAGRVFDQPSVIASLAAFAQARRVPFIDVYEDFKAERQGPLFYPLDGHMNARGHEVFAAALLRRLTARGTQTARWLGERD